MADPVEEKEVSCADLPNGIYSKVDLNADSEASKNKFSIEIRRDAADIQIYLPLASHDVYVLGGVNERGGIK